MKIILRSSFLLAAIVFCGLVSQAQVTSVTLNGSGTPVSFASGSAIAWEIHLPAGATSQLELWLDVNQNGQIDGVDKLWVSFPAVDGPSAMKDGPGDMDGTANGIITFSSSSLGLAPAHWLFRATNNNVGSTVAFTVTPLQNPSAIISGSVNGPQNVSRQYIILNAEEQTDGGGDKALWQGITDADGNYTIAVGSNPAIGATVRVGLANDVTSINGYLFSPRETTFTLAASVSGVNFQLKLGTVIVGRVTSGPNGLQGVEVSTADPLNPYSNNNQYRATTDANGYYGLTVLSGNYFVHFGAYHYFDTWWNNTNSNYDTLVVGNQDTIRQINANLVLSGVIQGHLTNYGTPIDAGVMLENNSHQPMYSTNTRDGGFYYFNVAPGSYFVHFFYDENNSMYYNNGNTVTVTGAEVVEHIDGNFMVGPPPPPKILNVWDVPNDQGRHVFVRWAFREPEGSIFGSEKTTGVIDKYSVWRRDLGKWTFAGEVPARGDSVYTAILPTLWDSTKNMGMHWSTFQVTAHSTLNLYSVNSEPDSGYSLDNLSPIPPANPTGSQLNNDIVLQWGAPKEDDVDRYEVYRSTSPTFSIDGMNPIGTTQTLSYTDVGANVATEYFYKIAGVDESGNRGVPSKAVSSKTGHTVGVDGAESLPTDFSLSQNYPNPFNPSTTIAYDLPKTAMVSVRVYNALGQEIATLVQSEQPAGRYTVRFNADNLATGLYIYKITAGDFIAVKKMSLTK